MKPQRCHYVSPDNKLCRNIRKGTYQNKNFSNTCVNYCELHENEFAQGAPAYMRSLRALELRTQTSGRLLT